MIVEMLKKYGPVAGATIAAVWLLRKTGYVQLTGY